MNEDFISDSKGDRLRVTMNSSTAMDLSWVRDGERWKQTKTNTEYDGEGRERLKVTREVFAYEGEMIAAKDTCSVYWGSHGCCRPRGHEGDCLCNCCTCENHPDPDSGCVAGPPYYGETTTFYGDDVEARGLPRSNCEDC